jgi:hypothetical protein
MEGERKPGILLHTFYAELCPDEVQFQCGNEQATPEFPKPSAPSTVTCGSLSHQWDWYLKAVVVFAVVTDLCDDASVESCHFVLWVIRTHDLIVDGEEFQLAPLHILWRFWRWVLGLATNCGRLLGQPYPLLSTKDHWNYFTISSLGVCVPCVFNVMHFVIMGQDEKPNTQCW